MQPPGSGRGEHYHVESRYQGHPDGDEDSAYVDLSTALKRADDQAAALRARGYRVEQIDTDDDVGVVREYHAAESDGTPNAVIDVRRCEAEGHV